MSEEIKIEDGIVKHEGIDFYPFHEIGNFIGNWDGTLVCIPMNVEGNLVKSDGITEVSEMEKEIWEKVIRVIPGKYKCVPFTI